MNGLVALGAGLNAYRLTFAPVLLDEMRDVYAEAVANRLQQWTSRDLLKGGTVVDADWQHGVYKFHASSYGKSPLLWISNDNLEAYHVFERFFRALDIGKSVEPMTDFEHDIVLYSGFYVVSDHMEAPAWHVDYFHGANAFTLMTPLFELDSGHGKLLYRDDSDPTARFPKMGKYSYKVGEAIVFGDVFAHSTEPYEQTSSIRVLVSLTFGSDKLDFWEILERTAGRQSNFMFLPCGHRRGTCTCLEAKARRVQSSRDAPMASGYSARRIK